MRTTAALVIFWTALTLAARGAETTFPYTAEISVGEVEVRCGPGWDYYVTQRLKRGDRVEVYRHEPGGWLAVRPPQGSFSWVTARQLAVTDDPKVAQVAVDGAVAWVGTTDDNLGQFKWQVRLERGERVEVLNQRSMSVGPGFATETYHQISPPAGEFRWIHAENAVAPGTRASSHNARTIQLADYQSVNSSVAATTSESPTAVPARDATPEMAREKDDLKVELSLLVTRQIDQWNLDKLKARADTLVQSTAGTALAREARAISQRIVEFETLRRRYQRMQDRDVQEDPQVKEHGVPAAPQMLEDDWEADVDAAIGTGISQTSGTAPSPTPVTSDNQKSADSMLALPTFDAKGWLMPVHSTKRVAPPFALLDDDGRVICYVTPAPGLNLRRYSKKYVGLFGAKRYVDELRASQITVERVVKQKH